MPRLTKFYSPIQQSAQALVEKIYALVSPRPAGLCNFLDAPELAQFLPPAAGDGERLRVVYRSYATLHFVFVVDSAESELGILDLIQVRACVRVCRPVRRKPLPLPSLFHSVPYPAPHRALKCLLALLTRHTRSLWSLWTARSRTCASSISSSIFTRFAGVLLHIP